MIGHTKNKMSFKLILLFNASFPLILYHYKKDPGRNHYNSCRDHLFFMIYFSLFRLELQIQFTILCSGILPRDILDHIAFDHVVIVLAMFEV